MDHLGAPYIFYIFALNSLLGVLFIYYFLPETLGRTFNEIEQFFGKKTEIVDNTFPGDNRLDMQPQWQLMFVRWKCLHSSACDIDNNKGGEKNSIWRFSLVFHLSLHWFYPILLTQWYYITHTSSVMIDIDFLEGFAYGFFFTLFAMDAKRYKATNAAHQSQPCEGNDKLIICFSDVQTNLLQQIENTNGNSRAAFHFNRS